MSEVIPAEAVEAATSVSWSIRGGSCEVQVFPSVQQHVTNGGSCWCGPIVDFTAEGHVVIHNRKAAI